MQLLTYRLLKPTAPSALCWIFTTLLLTTTATHSVEQKQVIGWIERVLLTDDMLIMEAKLDTGADYSSAHAVDINYYTEKGKPWVQFTLYDANGNKHRLERQVKRMAKIKNKAGGNLKRPVVMLDICAGNQRHKTQFNLADRGHFNYPLLLGRNFLRGRFLVDSSTKYLRPPSCD